MLNAKYHFLLNDACANVRVCVCSWCRVHFLWSSLYAFVALGFMTDINGDAFVAAAAVVVVVVVVIDSIALRVLLL